MSSTTIKEYFDNLEKETDGKPENIWNYDEMNLTDDPGSRWVITCNYIMRHHVSQEGGNTFKSAHVLWKRYGGNFATIHNLQGWITLDNVGRRWTLTFKIQPFKEWMVWQHHTWRLVLHFGPPTSEKARRMRVLIGDNLSSHISAAAVKACQEHNIALISLPPNSTHATQPSDIACFHPMKVAWRKQLAKLKEGKGSKSTTLRKKEIPGMLKKFMMTLEEKGMETLKSGSWKAGISPLNWSVVPARLPAPPEAWRCPPSCHWKLHWTSGKPSWEVMTLWSPEEGGRKSPCSTRKEYIPGTSYSKCGSTCTRHFYWTRCTCQSWCKKMRREQAEAEDSSGEINIWWSIWRWWSSHSRCWHKQWRCKPISARDMWNKRSSWKLPCD